MSTGTRTGTGTGYRERNSTADRALTLLQMFDDGRLVISANEVAEDMGVARSTAYRYLQTLVQAQFLSEDGRGGFRLGMKVLQLARLARKSYGLADVAVPAMRSLAAEFHQTTLLTKQSGNMIICLEREESPSQYIRLSYERGTLLTLNAGASALVLLAWLPEGEVRRLLASVELQRYTDATLTEPEDILKRLAEIREAGVGISYGEVDEAAMGVAAPVFGSDGRVVAAISIVLIQSRVSDADRQRIVDGVTAAGALLSEQISLLEE
ncbi:IclR family transcriptional regulator [Herbiconiux liukaitaii]|uniref:IclR family transcriptional regulator n=1 Tax=Herbiconiux liukaitaii TaxID=3342799 RepID=UPI0035BA1ABA